MARKRYTEERTIGVLQEAEAGTKVTGRPNGCERE